MRWRAEYLTVTAFAVALLGLVMVLSAGAFVGAEPEALARRQAVALLLGLGAYTVCRCVPLRVWDRAAPALLVGAAGLLFLVLLPGVGHRAGRATRWLLVGGVSVQPSELAKLAVVLYLAHRLARWHGRLQDLRHGLGPLLLPVAVVAGLVALEPDVGTAVLLLGVALALAAVAGAPLRLLFPAALVGIPLAVALLALRFEHVAARLQAFADPLGHYQLRQSLLALGSGGVTGVGLGRGLQKLAYLPQVHGDFLLAAVGEELGLLGTLSVVGAFALLVAGGGSLLRRVRDPFAFFLGGGSLLLLGLQAGLNVAVVTAAVPPKGIALPFLSQGGTALVTALASLGLLVQALRHGEMPDKRKEWSHACAGREAERAGLVAPSFAGAGALSGTAEGPSP